MKYEFEIQDLLDICNISLKIDRVTKDFIQTEIIMALIEQAKKKMEDFLIGHKTSSEINISSYNVTDVVTREINNIEGPLGKLEVGKFYRNGENEICVIIETINSGDCNCKYLKITGEKKLQVTIDEDGKRSGFFMFSKNNLDLISEIKKLNEPDFWENLLN